MDDYEYPEFVSVTVDEAGSTASADPSNNIPPGESNPNTGNTLLAGSVISALVAVLFI